MNRLQHHLIATKQQQATNSSSSKIVKINQNKTDIDCNIVFSTLPKPELSIHYEDYHTMRSLISGVGNPPKCKIELDNGLKGDFFVSSQLNKPLRLIPISEPISIVRNKQLQHVHFHIVNGPGSLSSVPQFFGQNDDYIEIGDVVRHRGGQLLNAQSWSIHIVEHATTVTNSTWANADFKISHDGCLARSDGSQFSVTEAMNILEVIRLLCSFVNGASCGITCITGEGDKGELVWEQYGCKHTARKRLYSSVLPGHVWPGSTEDARDGAVMQALFPSLLYCSQNPGWSLLSNSILFYLKSNETSELVASIVLNQIALESLSSFVVKHKLGGRTNHPKKLGGKILDALQWINVDPKNPQGCHELDKACTSYGKNHILHTLIDIRNNLTHANQNMKLSDPVCIEASHLGMWYVEILLLKILDYNSIYRNRLTMLNEPVPWI